MTRLGQWIELDQSMLNAPVHETIRGADVQVMTPPQDFPEAVRCYFDEHIKSGVIEFRYVSSANEGLVLGAAMQSVQFFVGDHSRRLYQIRFTGAGDNPEMVAKKVGEMLRNSLDTLIAEQPRRAGNYRATSHVIDFKGTEIVDLFNKS